MRVSYPEWLKWGLAVLLLFSATVFSYHNSLSGSFILDDEPQISQNPRIRQLWPLEQIFYNNRRPVLYLSLALNYAVGGLQVIGYHLFNGGIHFLAALVLFGIIRRSCQSNRLRENYALAAEGMALTVSLLWLVHPLQTESVTYLIQRAESLAGLFYFLTIYAVARRNLTPTKWWATAAVLACSAGMMTKETVSTAPLMALLYDRIFWASSWRELWLKRKFLYLGLGGSWLIMLFLLMTMHPETIPSAGFGYNKITAGQYFLTQAGVIWHYLRLAIWPAPLVFDYADWPLASHFFDAAIPGMGLLGLLALTGWALRRVPPVGFLGLWFFVVLSPSSSFVPIADVAFEHRMYLPLAAVVAVIVFGSAEYLRQFIPNAQKRKWLTGILIIVAAGILSGLTINRNRDYQTEMSIWQDTVKKRPGNARARVLYGIALEGAGRRTEAEGHYKQAIALRPDEAAGYNNLGLLLLEEEKLAEAEYYYAQAVKRATDNLGVLYSNYGLALARAGKYSAAISHYRKAMALGYRDAPVYNNLGIALKRTGRIPEAMEYFKKALSILPDYPQAREELADILTTTAGDK